MTILSSESMTNILIAILLLYNMWLVFYLLYEKRQDRKEEQPKPPSKREELENDTDVVGRSLFKMPPSRTTGDTAVPQAATSVDGEPLKEDDVTFADETPGSTDTGQPSMRLPDDKVEDAFSDTRLSDVPVEYEDGEDEETGEYASGATIEEMSEAVRTADNPQATESEKLKAGEVLHEMEGNELYLVLTAGKPQIKNKIRRLIDNYKNKPTISSGGNNEVVSVSPQPIPVVEGLEDFDIRDFV